MPQKTNATNILQKSAGNICWFIENAYLCKRNQKRGNSSVGRAQPCQGWGREFESRFPLFKRAQVAELVDAHVSGACVERHAGSSPVLGTFYHLDVRERWRNW